MLEHSLELRESSNEKSGMGIREYLKVKIDQKEQTMENQETIDPEASENMTSDH